MIDPGNVSPGLDRMTFAAGVGGADVRLGQLGACDPGAGPVAENAFPGSALEQTPHMTFAAFRPLMGSDQRESR